MKNCLGGIVFLLLVVNIISEDGRVEVQARGAYGNEKRDEGAIVFPSEYSSPFKSGSGYHENGHNYRSQYHYTHGQPYNKPEIEPLDFLALNSSGIPLDFAKSINDYSTLSDLLLNVIEDGPQMGDKNVIANRFGTDEDNENGERTSAQIARPAKCLPELQTVRIAKSNDPNVFYVPECTRVERCGGCCSHPLLSCQPTEIETVTFSVMKTAYNGNRKLKYVGKEPVVVEKHTKCKCGCKIKAEDCNSYQEYVESDCRCRCKNLDEEEKCYKSSQKKLWNPDVCACQCRDVVPCSTGYNFDYNDCKCVQGQFKRRYVLTEGQKEEPTWTD
ncbi:unnamed protein product [Ceutorhynchus assimilis]|uniref:Platelet-derived growth factor (PDGF) family profile domain-containing protein n=1 Tax=Ceutorhynchus assimilis TaxID=467358 RepID=A0A9N9MQJ0_9CUCU|nr:unnamed protein product [Ceutorhynchus assimilis]